MSVSLTATLREVALKTPAATAMIAAGQPVSYAQLQALVTVTAQQLRAQGVVAGDAVGLSMGRTPLHLVGMLAIARLGAFSVPLHPSSSPALRARLAAKFGLRLMVADAPTLAIAGLPFLLLDRVTAPANPPPDDGLGAEPGAEAPLRLLLTSGTTGEPKGILYSHGLFLDRLAQAVEGWCPTTRLLPPDMHLSIGFFWPLMTLCRGGTVVFPKSADHADQIAAIQLYGVTHFVLSPWSAQQLLTLAPPRGLLLPGLQHLRLVGAAPGAKLLQALAARVCPHIHSPYALTELATLTVIPPEQLLAEPGTVGRLRRGAWAEVIGPDGAVLTAGQQGEIRLRTTTMPQGYYRDAERTAEKFREGWFYTGDIGHLDAEGRLYIEGRADELLNIGGHKLLPELIEQQLAAQPGVREAAVFLMPGIAAVPELAAVLATEGGVDARAIQQLCRQLLGVTAPQRLYEAEALPRNASGKLQRDALPALIQTARRLL